MFVREQQALQALKCKKILEMIETAENLQSIHTFDTWYLAVRYLSNYYIYVLHNQEMKWEILVLAKKLCSPIFLARE